MIMAATRQKPSAAISFNADIPPPSTELLAATQAGCARAAELTQLRRAAGALKGLSVRYCDIGGVLGERDWDAGSVPLLDLESHRDLLYESNRRTAQWLGQYQLVRDALGAGRHP